jgi:hypothetical protein
MKSHFTQAFPRASYFSTIFPLVTRVDVALFSYEVTPEDIREPLHSESITEALGKGRNTTKEKEKPETNKYST